MGYAGSHRRGEGCLGGPTKSTAGLSVGFRTVW